MQRFWRGFRKASDLREREENARIKAGQLKKLRDLINGGGGPDDEREFMAALRAWKPGIKDAEAAPYLKQFRISVSGDPEHDPELD